MIVFVTAFGDDYCLAGLKRWPFEADWLPVVGTTHYDRLFRADRLPRATYVFVDIDRLYPWERYLAAERHRTMTAAGLQCLNDPARVLDRYPLLRALARERINPFDVYRADDAPRPRRFPVFLRRESDHVQPNPRLIETQEELERTLEALVAGGVPLADSLVVEYVETRRGDGLWEKSGTFRIGERLQYEQLVLAGEWICKLYDRYEHLWTDALYESERARILANPPSTEVARAFEIAGIEFGRADFAGIGGQDVVFEINTNPRILEWPAEATSYRHETRLIARRLLAEMLRDIDTREKGAVAIEPGPLVGAFRRSNPNPTARPVRP